MSFEVLLRDGSVFDLQAEAEAIQPVDRTRTYAISHARAVEGPNWETFGDGLEQPSQIQLSLYLKKGASRAAQRDAIERIEAAISTAAVLRNLADLREYVVAVGHITTESPTGDSYRLGLTFWPSARASAFIEGYPLGRWRIVTNANGVAELVPLAGVTVTPGTYTIIGADGQTFTLETLEATYG